MDSHQVGALLQECEETVEKQIQQQHQTNEEDLQTYYRCRAGLCVELLSLLQQAEHMQWPFVPERWQYKHTVETQDKTNLSELIKKHLQQLLALLKSSILAQECRCALAVVFLVDRFLYWTDESTRLLKITKHLHRLSPQEPVAPQLVIRQARVYLNSGKLQKAEYILSSLINNSGATGCWVYQCDSDRVLVQSVCVQVRGMILQKLGLWLEAAELMWASLVGFSALPQPDKKGIGTSLCLLSNILVSMNDEDFSAFKTNPHIDLSLLGESSHHLLSAAQAAKMAVVYTQYTSLYVLTNVVSQGTCLLSYSFSIHCPVTLQRSYLLQAKEAFEIGLLAESEGESVTSIQELHTFLKAAYSLTVTHKWLGTDLTIVNQATQACQEAIGLFYNYCNADNQDKDGLCVEIIRLVAKVKIFLQVEPFTNSDKKSFIPDSYKNQKEIPVSFTQEKFLEMLQKFKKFHATLCETNRACKSAKEEGAKFCITALGTTIGTLNTECSTEAKPELPRENGSLSNSYGSSWQKFSLSNSLRSSAGSLARIQDLPTTETDDDNNMGMLESSGASSYSMNFQLLQGALETLDTENEDEHAKAIESLSQSSNGSLGSSWQKFSLSNSLRSSPGSLARIQDLPTTETDDDNGMEKSNGIPDYSETSDAKAVDSLSQSSSNSLGSSWQKVSLGNSPRPSSGSQARIKDLATTETDDDSNMGKSNGIAESSRSSHSLNLQMFQAALETLDTESEGENSKAIQSLSDSYGSNSSWEKLSADQHFTTNARKLAKVGSKSSESSESLFHLETLDSKTPKSLHASNNQGNPRTHNKNELASPKPNPVNANQCAATATSTDSSFEMVGQENDKSCKKEEKNALCHNCLNGSFADSRGRYILTEHDYKALLSGVCHQCLLKRLNKEEAKFQLKKHQTAHSALHLKFSKATGLWTARETCVYIGEPMGLQGKQRATLWVQFLHQEERLSSYVGKDYLKPKELQFHLKDVERQMTAQQYVTEFNKSLYDRDVMAQIFFIPSEALLILEGSEIVGCVTVEPYMLGDFVKLTNNTGKKDKRFQATEYGLAFGHFTYLLSNGQEVVVDLQGWVTANGKGLTYLTDPQIHSTLSPKGPSNFSERGLRYFIEEQHGPHCNQICQLLQLPPVTRQSPPTPQSL